ncbi:uncharacterized protein N7477_003026 [Penicillium maclennaniae]|uniref:uncharacterized protein n=1 Tax=Penicillium maclennaniae TaxID=1343394 RepID=UPI00253FC3B7|nr:uncharacterized protein N7477_003026 [Penicillium maclennaniae]KAJ5677393.1 hypothetical protein N7477_003026 [Penicillium maclennaniae]
MRSFIYLTVSALAAVATANSNANPFEIPPNGYSFSVGEATTLKWDPTTSGTVSLRLQQGAVTTSYDGTAIASDIDNDGSYTWTVPDDVNTEWYTIEIISDEDTSDYNFLPRFTVAGATAAVSTTAAATTTSVSSTTTSDRTPASSSQTSVPFTNSGLVNRVSGGMMLLVAGAFAFL